MQPRRRFRVNSTIIALGDDHRTLAEWARTLNANHQTLTRRFELGWPLDKALTTPVRRYQRRPRESLE